MPRRSEAETGERRVWCRTNPCLPLAHLPNTITPTSRRGVASAYRREATPPHHPFLRLTKPRRNTLSHANKTRSSEVIKAVYSDILAHCRDMHPAFCARGHRCYFRFPRKLKRVVRAIDSTTIELISKCMDWAKHRKRKAAAKLHMSLDAASFLPVRIGSEPAKHHDSRFMVELCSGMKPGEIAVFDKAYVAYGHLHTLNERGIFRVTRAKDNACFDTKGKSGTGAGATSSATMRWNCTPIRAAGSPVLRESYGMAMFHILFIFHECRFS
ncbi:MAG: transposase [Akkermansia sp.]|nr:transposase [Akkermansia sp.]